MSPQSPHIMILGPDPIAALNLQVWLMQSGHSRATSVARYGEEAIAQAELLLPDLIITPAVLPGMMNGIQTAHAAWSRHRIPTIVLAPGADESLLEEVAGLEYVQLLQMPVDRAAFERSLERAIASGSRAPRSHASKGERA